MLLSDASGLHRAIKYRPDIDGLRATAIFAVVAYHVGLSWAPGGFVGVDVFFVISGYLIGSMVYKEIRGGSFKIGKFYSRRARRILPALFGIVIFCYAAALLILPPSELKPFSWTPLTTLTSSSNFYFWRAVKYFSPDSRENPLLMTWSLAIEEQFYLLFPLLLLLMRRLRWQTQTVAIGGLAALSFAASVWSSTHHPVSGFYLLPSRAWELGAGVLLAMLEASRTRKIEFLPHSFRHGLSVLGLGFIGSAILLYNSATRFPGYAALLPVAGAVLLIAAGDGVVNLVLSAPPLVFVGLVSYSWYLWHWPMLSFVRIVLAGEVPERVAVAIGLLSFILAMLSYRFVEQPFRASTTAPPLLLKRYAAVTALAMTPAILFFATGGLPQRNHDVQSMEGLGEQLMQDKCMIEPPGVDPPLYAPCVPPGAGRAVALIGDSHAAALAGALRTIAERSGYRFIELTKASCSALKGVSPVSQSEPELARQCGQFNRESLAYIEHDTDIQVVVIEGLWSGPFREDGKLGYVADGQAEDSADPSRSWDLLQLGLDRLVSDLARAGKTVYLLQDAPGFSFEPQDLMITRLMWMRRSLVNLIGSPTPQYANDYAPQLDAADDEKCREVVAAVAHAHPGVHLFDFRNAFCAAGGCRFAEGDQLLYIDHQHLSPLGARLALSGLRLP